MMTGLLLLLFGVILLSGSALAAFAWSVRNGQLNNLSESSKVIFDADEPIGMATDRFPRQSSRRS